MSTQSVLPGLLSVLEQSRERIMSIPEHDKRSEALLSVCTLACAPFGDAVSQNVRVVLEYYLNELHFELNDLTALISTKVEARFDRLLKADKSETDFDARHNTQTVFFLEQYELPEAVTVERLLHAARYIPSPVHVTRKALLGLQPYVLRYEDYVFVDVGSGAGRNLLLASEFPFEQIIGLEISQYLSRVAEQNVRQYHSPTQACKSIKLHCEDATAFDFPDKNLVLYFWEPFSNEIATRFFAHLLRGYRDKTKNIFLLFTGHVFPVVADSDQFKLKNKMLVAGVADASDFVVSVYAVAKK